MTEFVFKRYVCDICCSQYDTVEKAKECEESHIQIEDCKIAHTDYCSDLSYPISLHVDAPNGIRMVYDLDLVARNGEIVYERKGR